MEQREPANGMEHTFGAGIVAEQDADERLPIDASEGIVPANNKNNFAKNETDVLTAEEEVALAKCIEAGLYASYRLSQIQDDSPETQQLKQDLEEVAADGVKAKQRFIAANTGLVKSMIAQRYFMGNGGLAADDLISEGYPGLIRAVEGFDYKKGLKFSTYATIFIKGAVTRAIHNTARTMRIPVRKEELLEEIIKRQEEFQKSNNRDLTVDELASEFGIPEDELTELLRATQLQSLDQPVGLEKNEALSDIIHIEYGLLPENEVTAGLLQARLHQEINSLPHQWQKVVHLYFGFHGEPLTINKIAKECGRSPNEIRNILSKAQKSLSGYKNVEGFLRDYLDLFVEQ